MNKETLNYGSIDVETGEIVNRELTAEELAELEQAEPTNE